MSMSFNTPELWKDQLPRKHAEGHKYTSGHLVIYGAPELTGATRLAATAAARSGAGLVSVLATRDTTPIYKASLPASILVRDDLSWMDDRVTARVYGPGGMPTGIDFDHNLPTVLDASALDGLPETLSMNYILTPHEGEFAKLFPEFTGNKIKKTIQAAQKLNCHIILKGAETVIADPQERYILNTNASPDLATAGTGDVLAGMLGGFLAQGMPMFEAACAATWIHGECAKIFGKGLIADDIPNLIPNVIKAI